MRWFRGFWILAVLLAVLLALPTLCSGAGEATENPAWQFRSTASVAGEYVTLASLAELPPHLDQEFGQALIWTAPPPGQIYTLTREFLQFRLKQMGLADVVKGASLPPAIQIHQTGVILTVDEVANAFRRYVQEYSPWPAADLRVQVSPLEDPVLLPDRQFALQVLPPKGQERLLGDVILEMAVLRQDRQVKRFKVSGKVSLEQLVVCAATQLSPQTAISSGDVHLARRDMTSLQQREIFTSVNQVVGRILARPVSAQEILTERHLSHAPIIKRGQEVTVILDHDGLTITTKAKADEEGFPGRLIRMRNPKTKKEFQAEVVDARTVKVKL
jgi:flagella basal body P-ring formation protein FlgA